MRLDDLIIEIRDSNFNRIGQLRPRDLVGATFVLRYNNTGAWEIKLPSGHSLGEFLRQPGYGILVTGPSDTVIFSGPTLSARLEQTADNLQGDWLISGASDDIILQERLAYPTPGTDDVEAQVTAYDSRQGNAETVLKQYVNANIGPSAPVSRQVTNLTIQEDEARGELVQANARFQQLQPLLYDLAQTGAIGYQITQVDDYLEFQVYEPQDKSSIVRMDMENNQLSRAEFVYAKPSVTRAIVGGQGEDEWRRFAEVSNTDSLAAESEWGRRIEVFKDERSTRINADLVQSGLELLVDEGKTIRELSVTPSDDNNMRFAVDWYLGDKVTVVVNDIEASAVVTEIGITIQEDGVRIGATVGTPVATTYETKIVARQANQENRISSLERNVTGYGINVEYQPSGGTSGVQPVWTGNPITGSFNRFGNMVHFSILVDFDTITNFGTGQYYLTLPYPARVAYQFRDGCLHDASAGTEYHMSGHVNATSDILQLNSSDKVGSTIQDVDFTSTVPVTLTTADSFHISGTYEIEG
jgi:hypothetical protein